MNVNDSSVLKLINNLIASDRLNKNQILQIINLVPISNGKGINQILNKHKKKEPFYRSKYYRNIKYQTLNMLTKPINNKELKKDFLKTLKSTDDCKVSKASNEIMLDRFYDGKVIEFPFSK